MEHSFAEAFVTGVTLSHPHNTLTQSNTLFTDHRKGDMKSNKKQQILGLETKILEYLAEIKGDAVTAKAIQNLGLTDNILKMDLKELQKTICTNPFGMFQYQRLLIQKSSKLNSICKEIKRMNRMDKLSKVSRRGNQEEDGESDPGKGEKEEERNGEPEGLPKRLRHLKSYFKKALLDEINYRRKNMKTLNESPVIKILNTKKQRVEGGSQSMTPKESEKQGKRRSEYVRSVSKGRERVGERYQERVESQNKLQNVGEFQKIGKERVGVKNKENLNFVQKVKQNRENIEEEYDKYIESLKERSNRTRHRVLQFQRSRSSVDEGIRAANSRKRQREENTFTTNLANFIDKSQSITDHRMRAIQRTKEKIHPKQSHSHLGFSATKPSPPEPRDEVGQRQSQEDQPLLRKALYLQTISQGIRVRSDKKFKSINENIEQNRESYNVKMSGLLSKLVLRNSKPRIIKNPCWENFKLNSKKGELEQQIHRLQGLSDADLNSQLQNFNHTFLNIMESNPR